MGIVLPVVPVVIMFETGGFSLSKFPPILCLAAEADAIFYSLILPIIILVQCGISLLILIFWIIHKVLLVFSSVLYITRHIPSNLDEEVEENVSLIPSFWSFAVRNAKKKEAGKAGERGSLLPSVLSLALSYCK